jgi:uncharacterized membrane protein HdeD (DUF308 family)
VSDVKVTEDREFFSRAIRSVWWLTLIRGILLILLGVYALINPLMAAAALAQVIGIYLILDGAIAIYAGLTGQTLSRLWTTVRGVILIVVGLFVVGHPIIMAVVHATLLVCLLAVSALLSGVLEIYVAIRDRREIEGEGWLILSGALAIGFGLLLLASPLAAGMLMVQFLGAFAVIAGVSFVVLAFRLRTFGLRLKG